MDISSTSNPKVKYVRSLHKKKHRDLHQQFLIEGHKLIDAAIDSMYKIDLIFYTDNYQFPPKLSPAQKFKVSSQVMKSMTTMQSPPSVLGVANQTSIDLATKDFILEIIACGFQDPGNFGSLIRLAEALKVTCIWFTDDNIDPFHPKVIRGAMGSSFRMPVLKKNKELKQFKKEGYKLVATVAGKGQSIYNYQFSDKTCILFGSEGQGIPVDMMDEIDDCLHIPIPPIMDSLNVTHSCAMVLFEYARQKHTR